VRKTNEFIIIIHEFHRDASLETKLQLPISDKQCSCP